MFSEVSQIAENPLLRSARKKKGFGKRKMGRQTEKAVMVGRVFIPISPFCCVKKDKLGFVNILQDSHNLISQLACPYFRSRFAPGKVFSADLGQ